MKQQDTCRRNCASTACKQNEKQCTQSNANSEQVPSAISNSTSGSEDMIETRKAYCKMCGIKMPQSIDTMSSSEEPNASSTKQGSDRATEEAVTTSSPDGDSPTKSSPTTMLGDHSYGREILMRRRQQLQRPKPKHLFHKHTPLPATFTLPQKEPAAEPHSPGPKVCECRVDSATKLARSHDTPSHSAQDIPKETSSEAAKGTLHRPMPNGTSATTRRRWGGQAVGEWAIATAASGSNSLPPISRSTKRNHHMNNFEKLPLYLALNYIPRRITAY